MLPPELTDTDRPVVVVDVDRRRTVLVPRETVDEVTGGAGVDGVGSGERSERTVGARPHVSQ